MPTYAVKFSGRNNVFNVDYGNVAPRLSLAWNPGFSSGAPGHLFGNKKTVIRAGYGIGYDRVNTVQSVIIPMLGVGNTAAFQNGNVTNLFITMDVFRKFTFGATTFNNLQVFDLFMRSHKDYLNYHALVLTLRNRP